MRTASSEILDGRGDERNSDRALRACGLDDNVTLSSRSYVTLSTSNPRDFSRNFGDDDGTVLILISRDYVEGLIFVYHIIALFAALTTPVSTSYMLH